MLLAGLGGSLYTKKYGKNLKLWIVGGCAGSALMLAGLSMSAGMADVWPLHLNVFGLGFANGVFAVAAVSAMLGLASEPAAEGQGSREGARMGVWGAAQAIGFGLGGLLGAVIVDLLRSFTGENVTAFQIVFAIEAVLFIAAALVATGTSLTKNTNTLRRSQQGRETQLGEVIQS
jgi:BCD family chlorophyll transporter-like MFS transporter